MHFVQICLSDPSLSGEVCSPSTNLVWVEGQVLSTAEYANVVGLSSLLGFDVATFEYFVGAALMFWVLGLGTGLVVNIIKKARL